MFLEFNRKKIYDVGMPFFSFEQFIMSKQSESTVPLICPSQAIPMLQKCPSHPFCLRFKWHVLDKLKFVLDKLNLWEHFLSI